MDGGHVTSYNTKEVILSQTTIFLLNLVYSVPKPKPNPCVFVPKSN